VTAHGNGDYASDSFVPAAAGTYRWVERYGGDGNNTGAGPTACGDPAETISPPGTPSAGPNPGRNARKARVVNPHRKAAKKPKRHRGPRFTG
jgi:hypothetical protein